MASYSRTKVDGLLRARWPEIDFVAEGGNSFVFKSERDQIAIKVLRRGDPPRFERFKREVEVARTLHDLPGLIPPISVNLPSRWNEQPSSDEHLPFFTMRLLQDTLTTRLSLMPEEGVEAAIELMKSLCDVVAGLHERDHAHRDLKPDNILFDREDSLHVADYGLCIDLEDDARLTRSGELVGSITYRAPEFLRGRIDERDHRPADVFSLGRIMWALLHGREPHGLTDYEFSGDTSLRPIRSLRGGGLLAGIIEGCVNLAPESRPTVARLREALDEWGRQASSEGVSDALARLDEDPDVVSLESDIRNQKLLQQQQGKAQEYAREVLRSSGLFAELQGRARVTAKVNGGDACSRAPFPQQVLGVAACGMFVGPTDGRLPIPQLSLTMWTGFDEQQVWYRIMLCRLTSDGSIPSYGEAEVEIGAGTFKDFSGATVGDIERVIQAGLGRLRDELRQRVGRSG